MENFIAKFFIFIFITFINQKGVFMHIDKTNATTNFGAIFKFKKTSDTVCPIVEDALKAVTVPAEREKIKNKFQVGGGSLYVYVPDENMNKLLDKLKYIKSEAYTDILERID